MSLTKFICFILTTTFTSCNGENEKNNSVLNNLPSYLDLPVECSYYSNQQLKEVKFTKNGILEGPYKVFYDNGILKVSGTYQNGIAIGQWLRYDQEGRLENIQNLLNRDGKTFVNSTIDFDQSGSITGSSSYLSVLYYNDHDTIKKGDAYKVKFSLPERIFDDGFEFIDGYDDNFERIIMDNDTTIVYDVYEQTLETFFADTGKYDLNYRLSQLSIDTAEDGTIKTDRICIYYSKDLWVID